MFRRIRLRRAVAGIALVAGAALVAGVAVPAGAGASAAPAPRSAPAVVVPQRAVADGGAIAQAGTASAPASAPVPVTAPVDVVPLLGQAHTGGFGRVRAGASAPVPITAPLSPSQCQAKFGLVTCLDGRRLRELYGVTVRDQGQGATIALVMPYNNPAAGYDLDKYAQQAGLPRPHLRIIRVDHPVTADPANPVQTAAMVEENLDLQMMFAMAPRALLLLVETGPDFSFSPSALEYYAGVLRSLAAWRVDAVSLSLGWPELNYAEMAGSVAAGNAVIRAQATALSAAVGAGITFVVASGDTGATGPNLAGTAVYPERAVYFPASAPAVVAASGTTVYVNDAGHRTRPDTVWSNAGDGGATGGGLSAVFARPGYQSQYAKVTGTHRGVGDISMVASTQSPVWMYSSVYVFPNQPPGWLLVAGTSAAAPLFTGVAGDAAAIAGHPLGNIHAAIYAMAQEPAANGIERVTRGCNGDFNVPGYCASNSPYSVPGGIGTIGNGALFAARLAARFALAA